MCLTPDQVNFIENMVKELLRYETIIAEQSEVLRTDPPKLEAATVQVQQSPLVAKCGQWWEPTQDKVDEYLAQCNDLCQLVPQNFDELSLSQSLVRSCSLTYASCIKIMHGAHVALMCIIICKIRLQPSNIQLPILERHHKLS